MTRKFKSYSYQIMEFLKTKPVGYEFTARTLQEDVNTTPEEDPIPDINAVSACLTRHRRAEAITGRAVRTNGTTLYEYRLVDHSKLVAYNRKGSGGHKGSRHPPNDRLVPEPDLLTQTENMRGEQAVGPAIQPEETLDGMAEVKHHIRQAFKAYKKRILHTLPEIAVRSIPTDILLEELTRRVKDADKKPTTST